MRIRSCTYTRREMNFINRGRLELKTSRRALLTRVVIVVSPRNVACIAKCRPSTDCHQKAFISGFFNIVYDAARVGENVKHFPEEK